MELRHLRYFLTVAEELHLGRAAERLQMTQPPLSRQIQDLEATLGVQLFDRSRRHLQLTTAGNVLYTEAARLLAQSDHLRTVTKRAAHGEAGCLVIGFTHFALFNILPQALRRFRSDRPHVTPALRQLLPDEQIDALHTRRIDVGFVIPPIEAHGVSVAPVLADPLLVALPATHPLANQAVVSLRDLAHEPFIVFERQLGPRYYDQVIQRTFAQAGVVPHIVQEVAQPYAMVSLVAAGLGIALMYASIRTMQWDGVVYRDIAEPTVPTELHIIWRTNDESPLVHGFLQTVQEIASEEKEGSL